MSEVKNTKNQAAQAEDILREPSGAQKDSGTGGKKRIATGTSATGGMYTRKPWDSCQCR